MHEGDNRKTWYTAQTTEHKHQSAYAVHLRTTQPAITSWINKQTIISMTKQTDPSRQIHLLMQTRMQNIQKLWEDTWQRIRQQQTKNAKNTTNTNEQEQTKNTTTHWIFHHNNKHTQKLIEYVRTNEQPPELHKLTETDLRFITDIMRQITKNPPPEQINHESKENMYKQLHKCPTCPYIGEQEHHLIKHRQKKTQCKKLWEQEKNKDGNATKKHAMKPSTRKNP